MTTSSVCHHGASGAPAASVLGEPGGDGLLWIDELLPRNINDDLVDGAAGEAERRGVVGGHR